MQWTSNFTLIATLASFQSSIRHWWQQLKERFLTLLSCNNSSNEEKHLLFFSMTAVTGEALLWSMFRQSWKGLLNFDMPVHLNASMAKRERTSLKCALIMWSFSRNFLSFFALPSGSRQNQTQHSGTSHYYPLYPTNEDKLTSHLL